MAKQHSLTFRMTAFIVVVCALLVGTDIWRSLAARQVQLKEMTSATTNLARAMAQHANDTIKESDTSDHGHHRACRTRRHQPGCPWNRLRHYFRPD